MGNSVELLGVEAMLKSIRHKLTSGVQKLVEDEGLRAAGEIIAASQREKVAVSNYNHDHIKDDIKVSSVRRGGGLRYVLIGTTKKTSWRLHFLEYGTKKMPPQPFIFPSYQENKQRISALLAGTFTKGVSEG